MDHDERQLDELYELAGAVCNGQFDDEQFARLEAMLRVPQLMAAYLRYMDLHGDLRFSAGALSSLAAEIPELSEQIASLDSTEPLPNASANEASAAIASDRDADDRDADAWDADDRDADAWDDSRFVFLRSCARYWEDVMSRPGGLSVLFASVALAGVLLTLAVIPNRDQPADGDGIADGEANRATTPVALVSNEWNARWGEQSDYVTPGFRLSAGRELDLRDGYAEVTFDRGAAVVLQGPVRFRIDSENSGALFEGSLSASVPKKARGFSVRTPAVVVVDRGTHFGVAVESEGTTEVHVFEGVVEATASAAESKAPIRLIANEAARFRMGAPEVERAALNAVRFPQTNDSPLLAGLDVDRLYVEAVLASRPTAYWRFEAIKDGMIENAVSEKYRLQVAGAVRLEGDHRNRAISLRGSETDNQYLISESPIADVCDGDYAVEAWIRPEKPQKSGVIGLISPETLEDEGGGRFVYVRLYDDSQRRIQFRHRQAVPDRSTQVYSTSPYATGQWQHLVAQRDEGRVELYVDGKLAGMELDASSSEIDPYAVIGKRRPKPDEQPEFYRGELDELAIYGHALSREEIMRHYQLGRSR